MKSKHIIFLFIILVFFGCSRSCPDDFPIDMRYFPYSQGTILSFRNTQGDTLVAVVQDVITTKNKKISWDSKALCIVNYGFSSSGKVRINGGLNATASPDAIHYHSIHLLIEIIYNNCSYHLSKWETIEGDNYNVFDDTILLNDDQHSVTIIKGKGITEWTDENGEVWKLME